MATTTAALQMFSDASESASSVPDEGWSKLSERYRDMLFQQAYALLGCREDAEDVIQETFCEVLRNPAGLANALSAGNWLKMINRRNALNRLRDKRLIQLKTQFRQQQSPPRDFTTGGFNLIELRETVKKMLAALPPAMRDCVKLHYWNHLTCKQIAARLQMPEGSVKRLLYEANLRMHQMLNEKAEENRP